MTLVQAPPPYPCLKSHNPPMSLVYVSYLAAAATGQLHMMTHIFEEVPPTLTGTSADPGQLHSPPLQHQTFNTRNLTPTSNTLGRTITRIAPSQTQELRCVIAGYTARARPGDHRNISQTHPYPHLARPSYSTPPTLLTHTHYVTIAAMHQRSVQNGCWIETAPPITTP